jgi:hypothetical protein
MGGSHLWLPLILQIAVPLLLLLWLALGRHHGRIGWALTAVLVGAYLLTAAVAGIWLAFPWLVTPVILLLFALAGARSVRGAFAGARSPASAREWLLVATRGALALAAVALAGLALSGRRVPDAAVVDLTFPLRDGTFYVVNGGSVELINAHLATLHAEGPAREYRGQSYAVDIVAMNDRGARARGFAPRDPGAYAIFGAPIVAPCDGIVVASLDGLADLEPPRIDRMHMAGNHVVVDCDGAWIVLGHMRLGSVRVRPGDAVRVGERLGAVGNTGNTGEPHLHIHAQRPGTPSAPLGGEPLVMRFEGHYLARNAVVTLGR